MPFYQFREALFSKAALIILLICFSFITSHAQDRPRIIITADPELDDNNSLIRFLLYSPDLDIEGLVYTSSQFHWKGDGKGTQWFVPGREYDRFGMNACPCESWRWGDDERFIHEIVEAYEQVYPNLKVHDPNYPSPATLFSKIRYGNINFDGDFSEDTPGSELIKSLILDEKPGPLFITAWGGHSTIARALKSIREEFEFTENWEEIRFKVSRKVILLPSGDQDDTYATYIKPHWPDIEARQFRQGPSYGYGAQIRASTENAPYLTSAWMNKNISSRGPLGELYRVWGDGKQMVEGDKVDYFGLAGYTDQELRDMGYFVWMPVQEKGSWLGEGDNHTVMNMLGNGLRAYEKGYYGGWGGGEISDRSESTVQAMASEGSAEDMAEMLASQNSEQAQNLTEYPDFFAQSQRDFAARMKWSVTSNFKDANHAPKVKVAGPLTLSVSPGQKIKIHGVAEDPDGDKFAAQWFQMAIGNQNLKVDFTQNQALKAELAVPETAKSGQEIHLVLEVTDQGSPALSSYQRVILLVK